MEVADRHKTQDTLQGPKRSRAKVRLLALESLTLPLAILGPGFGDVSAADTTCAAIRYGNGKEVIHGTGRTWWRRGVNRAVSCQWLRSHPRQVVDPVPPFPVGGQNVHGPRTGAD